MHKYPPGTAGGFETSESRQPAQPSFARVHARLECRNLRASSAASQPAGGHRHGCGCARGQFY